MKRVYQKHCPDFARHGSCSSVWVAARTQGEEYYNALTHNHKMESKGLQVLSAQTSGFRSRSPIMVSSSRRASSEHLTCNNCGGSGSGTLRWISTSANGGYRQSNSSSKFHCHFNNCFQNPSHQKRSFWGWLNSVFNRVDESRIKEVGPDRACAEWLLRCGAGVKWDKNPNEWLRDYNSLPVGSFRTLKIVEIDATNSAVMYIGFPHLEGLTNVKKAIFHKCQYMDDESVRQIGYLKDTLEELQLSSCGNVTDEGILTLTQMKKLKKLKLWDFLEVRNRNRCLSALQDALPACSIYFPFAREEDKDPETTTDQVNEMKNKK